MTTLRDALSAEIDHLVGDIEATEKSHFVAADELHQTNFATGLIGAMAGALAAVGIVADRWQVAAAVAATIAALANAVHAVIKPSSQRDVHLTAARKLARIRVALRQLTQLHLPFATDSELPEIRSRVEVLAQDKADVDAESPPSTPRRYRKALQKINSGTFKPKDT